MKPYIFWLYSSRGTEQIQPTNLPEYFNKGDIETELEDWCSRFGSWHVSENVCHYGFLKDGVIARKKIQRWKCAKAERSKMVDDLIAKKITVVQFTKWRTKHKKVLQFPFS